jgi:hypothetical protein
VRFESASALIRPQKATNICVDLRTAEKVLKGLGRQPATPVATEAGTKKNNMRHVWTPWVGAPYLPGQLWVAESF